MIANWQNWKQIYNFTRLTQKYYAMGVIIGLSIILSWAAHLYYSLLFQPIDPTSAGLWLHIMLQTWLFTGLFITAHDSMHGSVSSRNRKVNYSIGFMATFFFAAMWYPQLLRKHKLHHIHVGTTLDPDYKTGNQNFLTWWISFMKQYVTLWQLLIMAILFNVGLLFFSEIQLIVLWIIPSILATFQLFYFGTYVPHHLPHSPEMEPYKARSQKRNHVWAMLTCYFFGYHYEHHASPQTPWWKLYQLKKNPTKQVSP